MCRRVRLQRTENAAPALPGTGTPAGWVPGIPACREGSGIPNRAPSPRRGRRPPLLPPPTEPTVRPEAGPVSSLCRGAGVLQGRLESPVWGELAFIFLLLLLRWS